MVVHTIQNAAKGVGFVRKAGNDLQGAELPA